MSLAPPAGALDRRSPVPFYFQLARLLKGPITSGLWAPGERLPSEPTLSAHFSVSRNTVRQALTRLEEEGVVERVKGRGTFVTEARARSWLLQSSRGFFEEEVSGLGLSVTSRVVRAEVGPLPTWACQALGLPEGSEGVTLARLRWVDGRLALYTVNHLPAHLADTVLALDVEHGSLYAELERKEGLAIVGGRRTVEAVNAGEELGRLLEVPAGTALAFIESVSWDEELRPFDCYQTWLRTDRTPIEVQATRSPGAVPAHPVDPTGAPERRSERGRVDLTSEGDR